MEQKVDTKDFKFNAVDQEGMDTLDVIADADKFNVWMYKTISKHCFGSTLEIGSGIGNISQYFINDGKTITLSDIRDNYVDILDQKYGSEKGVKGVVNMNLTDPDFDAKFKNYLGTFDSVFALNVVEHIEDDKLALENCYKLLKPGGHVVILVPAYQSLYNRFDKELEHFRRYTKKTLKAVISSARFDIITKRYFNFMGIFGWWVSGKLQKNKTIPKGQMNLYNKLVPIFKLIDTCTLRRMGLSVIVVGKKPQ